MFGGFYGNRIFRRIHLFISSTIDHSQHQSNFFKNFMIFPKKILQNYCFYEIYILFSIFIINASLWKIWNFLEHIIFVSYAIGNHERPRLRGNNFFFFNLSERMVLSNISRYIVRRAPIQNVCHTIDCVKYSNQTHWQHRESVIQKHMCLLCERDSMELRLLLIILYVVFVYNIASTLVNESFF